MSKKHQPSFNAGVTKRLYTQDMGDVLAAEIAAPPRPEDQEMRVDVTLDDFEPYEHNPRLTANEKYQEIKASIRQVGLDTEFVLTKRHPADPKYIERNGGGTRYRICQELWEETGEERFYRHNCLFRPWTDELSVLISHGIENDSRAPLIWVENALHVDRILQYLVEQDAAVRTLSMRDKAALISTQGWTITHTNLIYYGFTVDTLYSAIPKALLAGMGRRKIVALKNLQSTYRKYIKTHSPDNELAFEATYREALTEHDGDEEFDIDAVETTLMERIAALTGGTVDDVRFNRAAAHLSGNEPNSPSIDDALVSRKPADFTDSGIPVTHPDDGAGAPVPSASPGPSRAEPADQQAPSSSLASGRAEALGPDVASLQRQLNDLRAHAQSKAVELLRDHQSLIAAYEASEESKYFLGFMLTEPPVFTLPAEWLTGVVYWRLYHVFIAAMRTEKAAGYLIDIHADDLAELERQCDLPAIASSESFGDGQAFELQWRWNDLLIRHGAGLCNGVEHRAVNALTSLDGALLKHGRLVLQLRHASSETLSDEQR